jgi:hypothetical protein
MTLAEEALELARNEDVKTFNGLVRRLLERFVEERKAASFATSMAEMARDPAIRRETEAIAREFSRAESDGLAETG